MRYCANKECHADTNPANDNADANRIRTKKQYAPLPFSGGHN